MRIISDISRRAAPPCGFLITTEKNHPYSVVPSGPFKLKVSRKGANYRKVTIGVFARKENTSTGSVTWFKARGSELAAPLR